MVKSKFDELHKLYYFSSKVRNDQKKIDDFVAFTKEYEEKAVKGGFTNEKEKKEYQEKFEDKKEKAKLAEKEIEKAHEKVSENPSAQKKVLEKVVGKSEINVEEINIHDDNGRTKYLTDDIAKLNRKDRKLVSRIYGIIDNVLPRDIASILKEKIKEDLNK